VPLKIARIGARERAALRRQEAASSRRDRPSVDHNTPATYRHRLGIRPLCRSSHTIRALADQHEAAYGRLVSTLRKKSLQSALGGLLSVVGVVPDGPARIRLTWWTSRGRGAMPESTTPAGGERPPEEGIPSEPKHTPSGPPPDLRHEITRHPEPAESRGQEAGRERAGATGSPAPWPFAPRATSCLGLASLILGAVAVCSFGCGVCLRLSPRWRDPGIAMSAAVCVSPLVTLPGLALGLASLAQKGRSHTAGVVGCLTNGLILAVLLLLAAANSPTPRSQPVPRNPPEVPRDASDFFRR
jgi:hypothetical protein